MVMPRPPGRMRWLLALWLVAPVAGIRAGIARDSRSLRSRVASSPTDSNPADSEVIEGPDCGNAKQVIGKWQKAGRVGKIAGVAGSAVLKAENEASVAERAAARAKEIGEAITGNAGEYPEGIKLAAEAAEKESAAATEAATGLQTELDLFKGKISGSDFAGADVEDSDVASVQKLTKEATDAAGKAADAAKTALAKAKEGEKTAMESTAAAARMLKKVLDGTKAAREEAAALAQKASFTSKDVQTLGAKADTVIAEIEGKIANAEEQAPVWEALKAKLTAMKTDVEEADGELTTKAGDLDTTQADLKTKLEPIQTAADKAAGGSAVADMTEELATANGALDALVAANEAVKAKVGTVETRMQRLEKELAEVDSKLAKNRSLEDAKANVA